MQRKLALLAVASVALTLAACEDRPTMKRKRFKPSVEAAGQTAADGAHGYKLAGTDAEGKPCSTGKQRFETIHQMCMGLQDPVRNDGCAAEQRVSKFNAECTPLGYSLNESLECRVTLLRNSAQIDALGGHDPKQTVRSLYYCAGRTIDGGILDGVSDDGVFHDRVRIQASIKHVPRQDAYADHRTHFLTRLTERLPDGSTRNLMLQDEYAYDREGVSVQSGQLLNGKYKYLIRCERTWACDYDSPL